ncbi:MAG: hypothetical protein KBT88_08470 [Gammaproteobacteria bacterium]|nr:hypothetical protein [Gammaproteobacteria bacterium]MBQ0839808.1 hypothetical protein [Gammaproteobacteria bacterium]
MKARLLCALLVFVALNSMAWVWGDVFVKALLPTYAWSFECLTPYFTVEAMTIDSERGQLFVKVDALTDGRRNLAGKGVADGIPVSSSTLLGHALQPLILLLSSIPLWPVKRNWEYVLLCVLSLPVLLLIEVLDTPLVLAGALEDMVLYSRDPARLNTSILVQSMHFMNSGGRLALALLGAGLVRSVQVSLNKFPIHKFVI